MVWYPYYSIIVAQSHNLYHVDGLKHDGLSEFMDSPLCEPV